MDQSDIRRLSIHQRERTMMFSTSIIVAVAPLVPFLSGEVRRDVPKWAILALGCFACTGYLLVWWYSGQASTYVDLRIVSIGGIAYFLAAVIAYIVPKITIRHIRHRD